MLASGSLLSRDRAATPEATSATPANTAASLPTLGLMGTIPIYWGEADELGDLLNGGAEPHWARPLLERHYQLRPLATLTQADLAPLRFLLLAQPRALSPAENVALDEWVRGGGRVLLFADPLMTGESRFGIGDPRRPQDVILLSPILRRWGLELEFVEDQPPGQSTREIAGRTLPVNLPGRFSLIKQGGCTLEALGLLADCKIGIGRAVVFADAALLDLHEPPASAPSALTALVERALSTGEIAGKPLSKGEMPRGILGADASTRAFEGQMRLATNLASSVQNPP